MNTDSTPDAASTRPEAMPPPSPADIPLQIRMQILSTEHWSLLATRSLAWNETFTRASMFMSALSFSVVALALVGQASGFGSDFRTFALIVLPVVLFLGIATALRMDSSNYNDLLCIVGMNRIRAAYLQVDPGLKPFFITGYADDYEGIIKTMGGIPTRSVFADILSASPVVVGILNAVLVASIAGVACIHAGLSEDWAMLVSGLAFVLTVAVLAIITAKTLNDLQKDYQPLFPSETPSQPGPETSALGK